MLCAPRIELSFTEWKTSTIDTIITIFLITNTNSNNNIYIV